jgi:hypothetical protein
MRETLKKVKRSKPLGRFHGKGAARWLEVVLALLFGLSFEVWADTISVQAVADADMRQFSPDANFGDGTKFGIMTAGKVGMINNGELRRALIRFDLSGQLPAGAIINSVSVTVDVARVPPSAVNSTFDLRQALRSWDELSVTWNSVTSGVPWNAPGAEGPGDSSANASSSVFISGGGNYTFPSTAGLVADVQAWVDDASSNNGWVLVSEDESTFFTVRGFGTREIFDPAVLTIDFSSPVTIQTQPQSQTVFVGTNVTFNVVASGPPPLTYQWQFQSNAIAGATNSELLLTNVQLSDSGDYTVVVSSQSFSVTSEAATLTVSTSPVPVINIGPPPTNGERFPEGTSLPITISAGEAGGSITEIEVFLDTNLIGASVTSPFTVIASNLAAGTHLVTVTATDALNTTVTNRVSFLVLNTPSISIVRPVTGSTFPLGTNITVSVLNTNAGGTNDAKVTNVELFANAELIGQQTNLPFNFVWRPLQAQTYTLTASVLDEFGESITSAPVNLRIFTPDNVRPKLRITKSPANLTRLTKGMVSLAGVASDNVGLYQVLFQVNSNSPQPAIGTSNWTADVPLVPGINTVQVWAVDLAGNTNIPAVRFFTYVVKVPIKMQPSGTGTISPNLNGHELEIGKVFTVTAHPGTGQIFAGWSGAAETNRPALTFSMASNLDFTANFIPNPFAGFTGFYTGLFADTNYSSPDSSGSFKLQLGRSGAFSGKLVMGGRSLPFQSRFNPGGDATLALLRRGLTPVVLTMQLDLAGGTGELSGFVTNVVGNNVVASRLTAQRTVSGVTGAAPYGTGVRRFVIEEQQPKGLVPIGNGAAHIGLTGLVRFTGKLEDGRRVVCDSGIWQDGLVPFFASLGGGGEAVMGWVNLSPNSISGGLDWLKEQAGTNSWSGLVLVPGSPQ